MERRKKISVSLRLFLALLFYKTLCHSLEIIFANFEQDLEPPHTSFIEVRVLQDCGEIMTSYGETIKFSKDTQHYV